MEVLTVVLQFTLWQLIYATCKSLIARLLETQRVRTFIPSKHSRSVLSDQAHAYLVSTLHALFVTSRGLFHVIRLLHAPTSIKLLRPVHQVAQEYIPFAHETDRVLFTDAVLSGYLLADLSHVVYNFPKFGSWDVVFHHAAFLGCALIAGWYGMYPFMFGWLIIGEASTPLLNLRWFLIKAGKGSTFYFRTIEVAFALVFVIVRFFIFGAGLAHQLGIVHELQGKVPSWAIVSTMGFVIGGFVLNLLWIRKIVKLATGRGRKRQ